MAINYLDKTGLAYFWDKIKAAFVKKEAGKGLSAEDYTTAEKTKLAGIEAGANAYTLPTASENVKGGIKVGSLLHIDADGVLSAETGAMVINAGVARFSDGETVTIESLAPAELEQAAEDGRSVFLRLSMEHTNDTRILPLYRVVKSVISSGSTTPVDRYSFGFATDKTTMKLLISVDGENYTAEPLYLKTLSASELNALPSSEKGAANGVCPLGADGVIPEGYLPDQSGTYVIQVAVDQDFYNPTADEDELKAVSSHVMTELHLMRGGKIVGVARMQWRDFYEDIVDLYYFPLIVCNPDLKHIVYEVNVINGTISAENVHF